MGVVLLGGKRGGVRFSSEELELLTLLAQHVATVFENARLFDSATFEGLTGLYRREAVLEILDREWSRAARYERPLAIAVADLDRFKEINDRHGHLAGDLVLQRVAAELKSQLRETDFHRAFRRRGVPDRAAGDQPRGGAHLRREGPPAARGAGDPARRRRASCA